MTPSCCWKVCRTVCCILKHPYNKLTEDGSAAPYVHHPELSYALPDLSIPVEDLDYIEILE